MSVMHADMKKAPAVLVTVGAGARGLLDDLLMAVIAVCLAPAVHPIAADIILTALAVWAMRNSR